LYNRVQKELAGTINVKWLAASWRLELDLVLGEGGMEMGMVASGRQPPDAATIKSKITQSEIKHLEMKSTIS